MNEHLRGSGRTHRMVEKAYDLVRNGFSVFIMMYQRADIRMVEQTIDFIVCSTILIEINCQGTQGS